MSTVSTWTGWEANALRKALRMSVTEFAAHVGVARRTAAKWSSQGRDIVLRAEMQAALDTVLVRSGVDVRERFTHLRATTDSQRDNNRPPMEAVGEHAVPLVVARLLDVLLQDGADSVSSDPPRLPRLGEWVGRAKSKYQACQYEGVVNELVGLLPAMNAARISTVSDEQALHSLAADAHHVAASTLLKLGEPSFALIAAERSLHRGGQSGDPVAIGASARVMTHALISNGHHRRAVALAQDAAASLDRHTGLTDGDAASVYGALLLRGAVAAARAEDRDTADTMITEATRVADRVGYDGNDRWTGFGPTNVLQHRAHLALALGDAGTSIVHARKVQPGRIVLVERRAALFVDMARAYAQWGRRDQALLALRHADRVAPEEVRSRPAVHRVVRDLAALSHGHLRTRVGEFAAAAGIVL